MTGEETGEMKLRVTFVSAGSPGQVKLDFSKAEDGTPKSCGYAAYGDRILRVEDLAE